MRETISCKDVDRWKSTYPGVRIECEDAGEGAFLLYAAADDCVTLFEFLSNEIYDKKLTPQKGVTSFVDVII